MLPPLRPSNVRPATTADVLPATRRELPAQGASVRPPRISIKARPIRLKPALAILDEEE